MLKIGFIGWRGMVGSVLMERMMVEQNFNGFEPIFFSTSNVGGKGPDTGLDIPPLRDAPHVHNVKFCLAKGRSDFVLHHPRPVTRADGEVAVFDDTNLPQVNPD